MLHYCLGSRFSLLIDVRAFLLQEQTPVIVGSGCLSRWAKAVLRTHIRLPVAPFRLRAHLTECSSGRGEQPVGDTHGLGVGSLFVQSLGTSTRVPACLTDPSSHVQSWCQRRRCVLPSLLILHRLPHLRCHCLSKTMKQSATVYLLVCFCEARVW